MMKNISRHTFRSIIISALALFLAFITPPRAVAQDEHLALYRNGKYKEALDLISKELDAFYSTRVEDKRIPTGFITTRESLREVDLRMVFRDRKAAHFFIEDNQKISGLHLHAARCYGQLANYHYSLNHYIQALRYKRTEPGKDDIIYYEMAHLYLKEKHFNAYIEAMETASSLNPSNFSYSLEIGRALYRTGMKKRAIHHLDRYIKGTDGPVTPELYLMLGNLNEDIARYLETEKHYIRYLESKPEDGHIHFALGHIAYYRTGNYPLAIRSLDRALALLPESEIFKKSKTYEYKADIALQELEFSDAIRFFLETIKYQDLISAEIKSKQIELTVLNEKIRNLKSSLLKEEIFEEYEEYENLMDKKGKLEIEIRRIENEYGKLNSGKVRWNIAYAYERMERFQEAIRYYRMAISFDFNANLARKKIINLELKIKRGY